MVINKYNSIQNYKDLKFWQNSFKVSIQIFKIYERSSRSTAKQVIFRQLVRSSCSVGANIAEGYGRYKGKEYKRYLQIALGSANETEHWLLLLKEMSPEKADIDDIIEANLETIKMLATSLKTLNKKS